MENKIFITYDKNVEQKFNFLATILRLRLGMLGVFFRLKNYFSYEKQY